MEIPLVLAELRAFGGAIGRQQHGATAVAGRDAAFNLYSLAPMFPPVAAVAPAAAKSVVDALRPWAAGTLPNFTGPGGGGRLGTPWSDDVAARLTAVRERYDPAGLFSQVGLRPT